MNTKEKLDYAIRALENMQDRLQDGANDNGLSKYACAERVSMIDADLGILKSTSNRIGSDKVVGRW